MSANRGFLRERVLTGLFWSFAGTAVNVVLQVAVLAVLARLLTQADFGRVGAAMVVVGFSTVFSQMGVGLALVQRKDLQPRHVRTGFTLAATMGLVCGVAVYLLAGLAERFFRIDGLAPIVRTLALIFPVQGFSMVAESLLHRDLRFKQLSILESLAYALGYGLLGIVMALQGAGVWALVGACVLQALVKAAGVLALSRHSLRIGLDARSVRELMNFGCGITAVRLFNYGANQGDNLVIGRLLGAAALGIYGRAYQFVLLPATLVGQVVERVLYPALSSAQDDRALLARAYGRGLNALALCSLPTGVVVTVLAPELVELLLGPDWTEVVLPLRVLAAGMLFRTSFKLSASVARAVGLVHQTAWRQAVYAAGVIGGGAFGARYGIVGASAGVLGAMFINFCLMTDLGMRVTGTKLREVVRVHLPALATAGLVLAIALPAAHALRPLEHVSVTLFVVLGALLVAVCLAVRTLPLVFLGGEGITALRDVCDLLPAGLSSALQRLLPAGQEAESAEPESEQID